MKKKHSVLILVLLIVLTVTLFTETGHAARRKSSRAKAKPKDNSPVAQILNKIENRYSSVSFSANFFQESPIPEIQVTEKAQGKAYFKKPGKFRWEYEKPEVLHYISDGTTLWIHSPSDNNVWTGKSKEFFGKGSGANVLTDVKQIRTQFMVSIADSADENTARLKLVPKTKTMGFTDIFLTVDKGTYDILKIVSFNMNGEETRIEFKNLEFKPFSDDLMFNFKIPATANVIPLEQNN